MTQSTDGFARVAVLGLGTMGAGIAQVVAGSGRQVVVLEADQGRLDAGLARIGAFLDDGIRRGKTTEEQKATLLSRTTGVTSVGALAEPGAPDLVIESVSEDAQVKKGLLAEVARVVPDDVPIVTNTSALSVTDLATAVPRPERVAGLHFFNPVPLMRTVEVVRAFHTDPALVDRLVALVQSLEGEKQAAVVKDRPGFLVNALLIPYLNDVVQAYDDELASAEDIDVALRLGLGYKQGPLEMLDMIGLDVHLHATRNAYEATRDPRYAPPPLLQQMVTAGALGHKSGRGFRTGPNEKDR